MANTPNTNPTNQNTPQTTPPAPPQPSAPSHSSSGASAKGEPSQPSQPSKPSQPTSASHKTHKKIYLSAFLIILFVIIAAAVLSLVNKPKGPAVDEQTATDEAQTTEIIPESSDSAQPLLNVRISESENLPTGWPNSLPLSSYLINRPSSYPDGTGGSVTAYSEKPLSQEHTAFKELLGANGWKIASDTKTDSGSQVLSFDNDSFQGGAELYTIVKDPYLTQLMIFVVSKSAQ